jgi:hypothetical protein
MTKDFVAHKGSEVTIEWYFTTQNESPALNYFENLPANRKKKVVHLWYILGEGVARMIKPTAA